MGTRVHQPNHGDAAILRRGVEGCGAVAGSAGGSTGCAGGDISAGSWSSCVGRGSRGAIV